MNYVGKSFFPDADGAVYEEKLAESTVPLRAVLSQGKLVESTYYQTSLCEKGKMLVTFGGHAFHLILPDTFTSGTQQADMLAETETAEYAVASYALEGPFDELCFELMFEDHTEAPYSLQIDRKCLIPHYLTVAYHGQTDFVLKIYGDKSLRVLRELPLKVRFVPRLPFASEWDDGQYNYLCKHELEQVAAIMLVYNFLNDAQLDGLYDFRSVARFIRSCTGDYDWEVIKTVMYEAWYQMINERGIPFERIELFDMDDVMAKI